MKDILMLRRLLADIHYSRVAAITAVNERDETTLKRKISTIEAMLE